MSLACSSIGTRLTLLALTLASLLLVGCATQGQSSVDSATQAYEAKDYRTTYREATRALATADGPVREEAAYLAGLSAYHLGEYAQAERYLRQAALSDDPKLAGDAYATLGLLLSDRGQFARAADAMHAAAQRLEGEDQANAYLHAAMAEQRLGRWPQARTTLILARSANREPAFRERIDQLLEVTGFTVQVGAYASRANAEKAAEQLARDAAPLKLTDPWIIKAATREGSSLYLVQLGRFHTHATALKAREALGRPGAIVVPLAENR